MSRPAACLILTTALLALVAWSVRAADRIAPGHVGSQACAGCHQPQFERWSRSHHAAAMMPVSATSVLGRFDGTAIDSHGITARFFRQDGRYVAETDGRDGARATFEIAFTLGVHPLQQYLVRFPDGRIQALPFAWDARTAAQGGQRWFALHPEERIGHDDPLHWTGPMQNWNHMCAGCHATAVRRNYDAAADRFATTFAETGVGCEACHGPAQPHIAWANGPRAPDPAFGFTTPMPRASHDAFAPGDAAYPPQAPRAARPAGDEVELCGRCHARLELASENTTPGQNLTSTHVPELLRRDLFETDGTIKAEVFEYNSFLQSRMYAKGVNCSDCHDVHGGGTLRAGAAVCSQCHATETFGSPSHTGHQPSAQTPDCIACHMPSRTFMGIDRRHDHSFRIPRPDLNATTGAPDACTDCHAGRSPAWAAVAIAQWHGPTRPQRPASGEAFALARSGAPAARELLATIARDPQTSAIVKASALAELGAFPASQLTSTLATALADASALVRLGALQGLAEWPLQTRWRLAGPLVADPERAVRLEAAQLLADQPLEQLDRDAAARLAQGFADYEQTQRLLADRPEARARLGSFLARRGRTDEAIAEYRNGLLLDPSSVALAVNLDDLERGRGDEAAADATLRTALARSPSAAALHHALGLSLVRRGQLTAALTELKAAIDLAPSEPRFAYVYAAALRTTGAMAEARAVLEQALGRSPWNADILAALLQDALAAGDSVQALDYTTRLAALRPDDARFARLLNGLRRH